MDGLLRELNEAGYYTQAYADDLVILISDRVAERLSGPMTRALGLVERWCLTEGLNVNPDKAEMVVFTRKRRLGQMPEVNLFNQTLRCSGSTKYLGIIIDSKLTWKEHLSSKIKKANNTLWACKRAFSNTWGLKPKIHHWIYTGIVRPMITYGAIIWWPVTKTAKSRALLDSVQRLACMGTTGAMRTAPTRAIERLVGLPPLHLFLENEALRTAYRLQGLGHLRDNKCPRGHIRLWNEATLSCPALLMKRDKTLPSIQPRGPLKFFFPSREEWRPESGTPDDGVIWYTDGSGTGNGAGAGVYGETTGARLSYALGSYASVFQAEIYAILKCGYENLRHGFANRNIYVYSDSRAALLALSSNRVDSALVAECRNVLNAVARQNRVNLVWVPGHSDVPGNEEADRLARRGSADSAVGPEPVIGLPYSTAMALLKGEMLRKAGEIWRACNGMRQAKLLMRAWEPRKAKAILKMEKKDIRLLTGLLTGHCHLSRHLSLMGIVEDPECRG